MEKYEELYRKHDIDRLIRNYTPGRMLAVEGGNDERTLEYTKAATEEIRKAMRTELKNISRMAMRSLGTMEGKCKKYKTLGATSPEVADTLREAYVGVLRKLIEVVDEFDPREDWEKAHDTGEV